MKESGLFTAALGLTLPWRVSRVEFDPEHTRLDLYLDFPRGARFACPATGCGQGQCPVHDTTAKTWRHMDLFQHKAFLHARLPRVRCRVHGVRQVGLPWAREGSGFTLLFEALLLQFAAAMPVRKVAEMTREQDTRIWRVLHHHVDATRACADYSRVERVGMDETAVRRDEVASRPELKRTRWLWLKNHSNLTDTQQGELYRLTRPWARLVTARALRWREDFQAFYHQPGATAERHWDGIVSWHASRLNNGLLEGINSLVQAAKAPRRRQPRCYVPVRRRLDRSL